MSRLLVAKYENDIFSIFFLFDGVFFIAILALFIQKLCFHGNELLIFEERLGSISAVVPFEKLYQSNHYLQFLGMCFHSRLVIQLQPRRSSLI